MIGSRAGWSLRFGDARFVRQSREPSRPEETGLGAIPEVGAHGDLVGDRLITQRHDQRVATDGHLRAVISVLASWEPQTATGLPAESTMVKAAEPMDSPAVPMLTPWPSAVTPSIKYCTPA